MTQESSGSVTDESPTLTTYEWDVGSTETLWNIAADSVDLVVSSPPYLKRDGYSEVLMLGLGRLLARVLKPGARAFVNFGTTQEGLFRAFEAARLVGSVGLTHGQTIVWVKSVPIGDKTHGHFQAINSPNLLNYTHEYVFQFYKGDPRPLDRLAVGVPYTDKSNMKRGTRGKNGDVHCGGDTWFIPYETTGATKKKPHHHGFPLQLPLKCIKLAGLAPRSIVLDPFSGGGTTAVAAKILGHHAIALDVSLEALKQTELRWGTCEG
jgi:site-specific DNA-methyltransferase (adenine-specific)